MVETDRQLSRKLERKGRACHYCGKLGHTKFECKEPRRPRETRCKVCSHDGVERVTETSSCHCPGASVRCLERFTGRKQKDSPAPHTLSIVTHEVPLEVNLNEFGKELMSQNNAGITWNQYSISRPWADDPHRSKWVRITFMDQQTKDKFVKRTMHGYISSWKTRWSYVVNVRMGKQTLALKFHEDKDDLTYLIIGKALQLVDEYEGLSLSEWTRDTMSLRRGLHNWHLTSEQSVEKVRQALDELDKKSAQRSSGKMIVETV